jgi:hypothetical protein
MGNDWPASRVLAVIGGVLGILVALVILVGAMMGTMFTDVNTAVPYFAAAGVLGIAGLVHLVLGLFVLGSAYYMLDNPRLHGGLLILWGVIGLFLGFGFWIGAVLVLIGGILALTMAPSGTTMGRRPAV